MVRHESESARWESHFRPPDSRLREYVQGEYQGWVESSAQPTRRRELPTPIIPLILNLGPPFEVAMSTDPTMPAQEHSSFVAGLSDAYATAVSCGSARCIQVNLTPIGAHLVLGVAMHELAHRSVELADLLGAVANELVARLHDARSWSECFVLLDDFLLRRLAAARALPDDVLRAWRLLSGSAGRMRIGALAAEIGRSERHLVERFRNHVGLPPKTVARILRFDRAANILVRSRGDLRLAALAHECGYHDQAHFNREFLALSGETPGELLLRRLADGGVAGD